MAAELTLPRTAAWVWHGEPRSIFGLDAVFVRCASGSSGTAPSGFSYADNFRAWLGARGPAPPGGRVRGPAAPARADRRPRVLDLADPRRGRTGRRPLGRLRRGL